MPNLVKRATLALLFACSASLLPGSALLLAAESIESVENALIEAGKKIESLQFRSRTVSDFDTGGWKFKQEMDGTYWYMQRDDKLLYRMEMSDQSVTIQNGKEESRKSTSTMVCDGEFLWMLTKSNGQETVIKQKAGKQNWFIDKSYFDNMRQMYDLKLLPDGTIDARPVHVIEATAKGDSTAGAVATMLSYHDKQIGMAIKSIAKDAAGKILTTTTTTDLKVNSDISSDRFVFKVPDGVQVVDMTQTQTPPEAAPEAQKEPATSKEAGKAKESQPADESEKVDESEKKDTKKKKKGPWPKIPKPKWP